ncbi:MAG: hypothetical protein L0H75_10835, partial [Nitrosospira sp.]|nr:hypothetical protein [Nitrosospira sp.]
PDRTSSHAPEYKPEKPLAGNNPLNDKQKPRQQFVNGSSLSAENDFRKKHPCRGNVSKCYGCAQGLKLHLISLAT